MLPRVGELRGLRLRPAGPALQRVEPDFYTQFLCLEQLGHASIQETVDTYGKWLRKDGRGAVDTLCTTGWKAASAQL